MAGARDAGLVTHSLAGSRGTDPLAVAGCEVFPEACGQSAAAPLLRDLVLSPSPAGTKHDVVLPTGRFRPWKCMWPLYLHKHINKYSIQAVS